MDDRLWLWLRRLWICGQRKGVVHKSTGETWPAPSGSPNGPTGQRPRWPEGGRWRPRTITLACIVTHSKQRRTAFHKSGGLAQQNHCAKNKGFSATKISCMIFPCLTCSPVQDRPPPPILGMDAKSRCPSPWGEARAVRLFATGFSATPTACLGAAILNEGLDDFFWLGSWLGWVLGGTWVAGCVRAGAGRRRRWTGAGAASPGTRCKP